MPHPQVNVILKRKLKSRRIVGTIVLNLLDGASGDNVTQIFRKYKISPERASKIFRKHIKNKDGKTKYIEFSEEFRDMVEYFIEQYEVYRSLDRLDQFLIAGVILKKMQDDR